MSHRMTTSTAAIAHFVLMYFSFFNLDNESCKWNNCYHHSHWELHDVMV